MKAAVHVAVGASGGLLALLLVRPQWRLRTDFLLVSLLGAWALIPDFWWFFSDRRPLPAYHFPALADTWKQIHGSTVANVFWGHHFLDQHETGHAVLEAQVAMLVLITLGCVYVLVRPMSHSRHATT